MPDSFRNGGKQPRCLLGVTPSPCQISLKSLCKPLSCLKEVNWGAAPGKEFLQHSSGMQNNSTILSNTSFFVISNLYGVYIPYITFRTRDQKGIMIKLSTQDCLSKQEEQHSFNHFHSGRSAQCGTTHLHARVGAALLQYTAVSNGKHMPRACVIFTPTLHATFFVISIRNCIPSPTLLTKEPSDLQTSGRQNLGKSQH